MMNDVDCKLLDGSGNGGTGVGSTDKIKGGNGDGGICKYFK